MMHANLTTDDLRMLALVSGLSAYGTRSQLFVRLADVPMRELKLPTGYRVVLDSGKVVDVTLSAEPARALKTLFVQAKVLVPTTGEPVVITETGRTITDALRKLRIRIATELGYTEFVAPWQSTRNEIAAAVTPATAQDRA